MQLTGRQTQFYIDIIYGVVFLAAFSLLLFWGMDAWIAAFMGGLILGYFLRVWENMSVYERILREEVAAEAERAVADEAEAAVAEEAHDAVTDEIDEHVAHEVTEEIGAQLPGEVERQVAEEMAAEIRERVSAEVSKQIEREIERRLARLASDRDPEEQSTASSG